MKTVFLSGRIPDKQRKIAANERQQIATAGTESTLILLKVPERDNLTLQMEQVGSKNALSWWCNVRVMTPNKKQNSDRKITFFIGV